jgi:hypothetical protein
MEQFLDERFNTVLVGQQSYTQWIYTDLNPYDRFWLRSTIMFLEHRQYQISVTPRYDESHISGRTGNATVDIYLNEGVYDREWENAIQLWKDGRIDTILISTWNEFPERTAIEPHYDATAANQSKSFLYDKTKYYINSIHNTTSSPSLLPMYLYLGITITSIIIAVSITQFYIRPRKRQNR